MQRPVVREHELRDADHAQCRDEPVQRIAAGDAEADRETRARPFGPRAADAQHAHRTDWSGYRETDARRGEKEADASHTCSMKKGKIPPVHSRGLRQTRHPT